MLQPHRVIDNDYHIMADRQRSVINQNINFFQQDGTSQSFKQPSAPVVDSTMGASILRSGNPYGNVPSAVSGQSFAEVAELRKNEVTQWRRRDSSTWRGDASEPADSREYTRQIGSQGPERPGSKTARSISLGRSSAKGRKPLVKPQTRRQNISPLIIRTESQVDDDKHSGSNPCRDASKLFNQLPNNGKVSNGQRQNSEVQPGVAYFPKGNERQQHHAALSVVDRDSAGGRVP